MSIYRTWRQAWVWSRASLHAAALGALVVSSSAFQVGQNSAVAAAGAEAAQNANDDPCRYFTAEAMGKAFGRTMTSSKLVDVCVYRERGSVAVVVKIATGPEGTILGFAKKGLAQGQKEVAKVPTAVGEAYFDSIIPVFIGRAGNREVQIESMIQPTPRDAMIAVGTTILESLARK